MGFRNASLEVTATDGNLDLLAFPTREVPRIETESTGEVVYSATPPRWITRVGHAEDSRGVNAEPMGFWYEPDPGWMVGAGIDTSRVTGEFSVFLNNATVAIREAGEVVWKNWTGHRESADALAAHAYEQRLLRLDVIDGDLSVSAPDGLRVYGSSTTLAATGALASGTVDGTVDIDNGRYRFAGESLRLEGRGEVSLERLLSTPAPQRGALALGVHPGSDFTVTGGSELVSPDPTDDSSAWSLITMAGVGIGLIGAAVLAARVRGGPRKWMQAWRSRRYSKWMTRGRELAAGRDFDEAALCFQRATDLSPSRPMAWFHLALAALEGGQPRRALEIIEVALEQENAETLDLLEIAVEAAWHLGDDQRCRDALAALLENNQALARMVVRDLELGPEVLGPELADRIGREQREQEDLSGYV